MKLDIDFIKILLGLINLDNFEWGLAKNHSNILKYVQFSQFFFKYIEIFARESYQDSIDTI